MPPINCRSLNVAMNKFYCVIYLIIFKSISETMVTVLIPKTAIFSLGVIWMWLSQPVPNSNGSMPASAWSLVTRLLVSMAQM